MLNMADGTVFQVHESSFVDDGAFQVVGPTDQIIDKTIRVGCTIVSVFRMFNMSINWLPGKTECTFNIYGPGKSKARTRLENYDGFLQIQDGDHVKNMVISKWYRHLGTALEANGDPSTEVCLRSASMKNETFKLSKNLLGNPNLPLKPQINILQAYILSKGMFQSCTWPTLKPHTYRKFHGAILSMYRSIVGKHNHGDRDKVSEVFTDDDIIYEFNFMCPRTMLRLSKLILFSRLVSKNASMLLGLAKNSISTNTRHCTWANSLMEDFRWLSIHPDFSAFVGIGFSKLLELFAENGRTYRNAINRYCRTPHANISCNWTTNDKLAAISTQHVICRVCKKVFKDNQACSAHEFPAHGLKHPIRNYVEANRCTVCLKVFDNREAAINHVRYKSNICYANLIARGPRLTPEESEAIDKLDHQVQNSKVQRGKRRHTVDKLCCLGNGPIFPVIIPEGGNSTLAQWLEGKMTTEDCLGVLVSM